MRLISSSLAPNWAGAAGEVEQLAGVVGGLQDAGDECWLVVRDTGRGGLGGADGVLEAVDAGEVGDAFAEGGVLDSGAVDELVQTLAASTEPWTTVFRLAGVVAGRQSELLGLWWENLDLRDPDAATVRFTHQVDRQGRRVELKAEESKATLPLPRSAAVILLEHKARTRAPTGPRSYVFGTRTGRPVNQREVLRALHRAQERARDADGRPTFPELFEHNENGHLVVGDDGGYVLRDVPRKELPPLPDFHALRHTAAMDCDDAEEARDLLRHRNSNVTRAIYRAHFDDRRRANLRARMEARMEATEGAKSAGTPATAGGQVADLQRFRAAEG